MSSSWGAVRTDKGASVLGKAGDGPGSMQWLAHIGFLLPSRARAWALNAERLGRKLLPPAGSTSSALASEVTLGPASASRARGEGVGCIGGSHRPGLQLHAPLLHPPRWPERSLGVAPHRRGDWGAWPSGRCHSVT